MSEDRSSRVSPDRETFLRRLNETTRFIRPEQPIDPSTVTNATLIELGLPPRPERDAQPLDWELWQEFFSPRVEFLKGDFTHSAIPAELRHYRETSPSAGSNETSANWSGAYVTPDHARRFKEIYGAWTVPAVTAPAQGPPSPSGTYYSSIFVGLDGQRRHAAGSLPQIGTRQNIDAAGTHYETWWEWFARGQGSWPTQMPLQVAAGQRVMCWLTVIGPTEARFMMRNLDTRFAVAFVRSSPVAPAAIPGVTAEWVMERPTGKSGDMERLPDYGELLFRRCVAAADGGTAGRKHHDLTGARLIRMMERRRSPWRGTLVSAPARIHEPPFVNRRSFAVSYRPGR